MKLIITLKKVKLIEYIKFLFKNTSSKKVADDIIIFEISYYKNSILFRIEKKLKYLKSEFQTAEIFCTEEVRINKKIYNLIKNVFGDINNVSYTDFFMKNLNKILKSLQFGNKLKIALVAFYDEEKIYTVIDAIKDIVNGFSIFCNDEILIAKINSYAYEELGIYVTNIYDKKEKNFDVCVIVNCDTDIKINSTYMINLDCNYSPKSCNLLEDVTTDFSGKLNDINIKKCYFMKEDSSCIKLKWTKIKG